MPVDATPLSATIVIPAFNEEQRLARSLPALADFIGSIQREVSVIVVDDGSQDRTAEVVESLSDAMPYLRVIRNPHRGKGGAVQTGMLAAMTDCAILCDADFSMPPTDLALFFAHLDRGVNIVIGSREGQLARRVGEPPYRHMMGRIFNSIVRLLAVRDIQDTQCGFKAFRRPVAQRLFALQRSQGFGFDVEILYLAQKFGYTIVEQPVRWVFDADTRVRPGIDTLDMVRDILRIRANDARGLYR